jgi:uncharacterized membrane protein YbhN (UPF0104 family)
MNRFLALAAKIAISAALLYFAFSRVEGVASIAGRLQQAKISWLVALLLSLAIQLVLVALRWRQIGKHCAAPFPFAKAFRYVLISSFFNQTLPSSIGGDAARIWFVSRTGAGWKAAAYSVIVDRIIGLAVLVAIVVVCLLWLFELVSDPFGRAGMLLVDGAGIVATIAFLILGQVHWRWLERWWITRHLSGAARVAINVLRTRNSAIIVVGLSIVIHLLTIAAVLCAARAVAAPLEFGQALLLVPPVILVATIPISIAGWGLREGAMMTVFAYAGLLQADGLIVSILFGASLFAIGAVGGAIWILGSEPRMQATDDARKA